MPTSEPIDHDSLFKELIRVFTYEFITLFAPKLAADLDRDSFEFLDKELLQLLDQGERKEVDLLVKAKLSGQPVFFLIHFEVQSSSNNWSPVRMFQYTARLYERFGLPIYPIALLTWDSPKKETSSHFSFGFPHFNVLQFNFPTIQLNRLNWRDFMRIETLVATALMAKMNIPKEDRPYVKLEYLRMIVTLKLDRTKSALIWQFMETYLQLNQTEEQKAQTLIEIELPPENKNEMRLYNTSFHDKGRAEGILIGIEQGKAEGEFQAKLATTKHLIERKFGESVLAIYQARLEQMSLKEIDALFDVAIFFNEPNEIEGWFNEKMLPTT